MSKGLYQVSSNCYTTNPKDLDWIEVSKLSMQRNLPIKIIEKFKEKLDWDLISRYHRLTPKFIEKFKDRLNWKIISQFRKLTPSLISKCITNLTSEVALNKSVPKNSTVYLLIKLSKVGGLLE